MVSYSTMQTSRVPPGSTRWRRHRVDPGGNLPGRDLPLPRGDVLERVVQEHPPEVKAGRAQADYHQDPHGAAATVWILVVLCWSASCYMTPCIRPTVFLTY